MQDNRTEIIEREFGNVLETIGLMWLNTTDEDYDEDDEGDEGDEDDEGDEGDEGDKGDENTLTDQLLASISFTGSCTGQVRIDAPLEMCVELSSNMLGIDADDPAAQMGAEDALKELLNVTCGRLLTALYGEEPIFDITPPMVRNLKPEALREFQDQPNTCAFMADDYPVWIYLNDEGEMKSA